MSSIDEFVNRDHGRRSILVPGGLALAMENPYNTPLIALVATDTGWDGNPNSDDRWEFWVYGEPTTWADLTDEQRMVVRLAGAWDGQVRDYWVELEYEDEGWYGLEALDQL